MSNITRASDVFSRRSLLRLGVAAGVGAVLPGVASAQRNTVAAPAVTESPQGAGSYRFRVGKVFVSFISDGTFLFDPPYPLFGADQPEATVLAALEAAYVDPRHVVAHIGGLLIEADGKKIVIDTGCGTAFGPTTGFFARHLERIGVKPADVDTVIISHAHPDHIGGLVGTDGKPVFSEAEVMIGKTEHAFWTADRPDFSKAAAPREMIDGMISGARATFDVVKPKPVADDFAVGPVQFVPAFGHTPGHLAFLISDGEDKLFHVTDAAHHFAINLPHPDWKLMFDHDTEAASVTRRKILQRAVDQRLKITGAHLPFPAVGYVKKQDDAFVWQPAVWEW